MATAAELQVRDKLFIGGEWVEPPGSEPIEVINSTTEEVMGTIPAGSAEDADRAVAAARDAFDSWSQTSPRGARRLPGGDRRRARRAQRGDRGDDRAGAGDAAEAEPDIQAGLPTGQFGAMPGLMEEVAWEEEIGNSRVLREPVGVLGAITPWNYPLNQIAAKVAPALAAGCTVVLKPSEVTPLNAFILAEVIEAAGLPAGVFNLVTGTGPVVGEAIAGHPGVDMVSFTGSTRAGKRVSELASATVKPVAMELGGKSPNVILDDADLARAVPDGVAKCFLNSGQTCSALTRMLVPREKLGRGRGDRRGGRRGVHSGRPVRRLDPARPARLRRPARARARLHREGRGRGREAGHRRRRGAGGARPRLLRPPHRLLRGDAGDDDRPGGDLRPGAGDPALRRRGRRGADRQRQRLRARRRRLVGRPGAGDRRRQAASAPARSRSTAAPSTRWPRSAATSSPATAARTAATGRGAAAGQVPAACSISGGTPSGGSD